MNKRLKKMIDDNLIPNKGGVFIDAYNQSVNDDIAGTITTRVDASNMTFITDMNKIPKPTSFENVEQVFRSHTLNEILPYLPDEDCFFDSRHWVYDTTDGVLPFSVTTRIDANNQQFLKEMNKDNKPIIIDDYNQSIPQDQDVIGTITTNIGNSAPRNGYKIAEPLRIPQATAQGYVEVEPGSLFDGSYPNSKTRRGRVQDNGQSRTTLTANGEPPYYYEGVSQLKHNMYEIEKRGISETNYKTNTGEILRLLRDKIGEKDYQWAIGRFRSILKEEILQSGLHEESICETRDKQSGIFSCTPHIQKDCVSDRRKGDDLREVRIDKKHRCASHRWELSEQFKREFDDIVSELSLKNSSSKIHLCDLWETFKSPQSLQLALFTMEEIWESFTQAVEYTKATEYRIRKLTPREVFRLMGVSESDIDKIQAAGISNSQQYKMAGNSIVVDVLEHIFRKLFVDRTQETQQLWMF